MPKQSVCEKILELAEELGAEEKATLAGMLLDGTPCDLECMDAFLKELTEENKGELACRLSDEA